MSKFKNSFFGGYNKADVNAEISALNKKITGCKLKFLDIIGQ